MEVKILFSKITIVLKGVTGEAKYHYIPLTINVKIFAITLCINFFLISSDASFYQFHIFRKLTTPTA